MRTSIPWWQIEIPNTSLQRIASAFKTGWINDGPLTTLFEKRAAQFLRVPYAIAVTSGTAALFAAIKAHGIGPGDEVLIPDLTFIATANAVSWTGARPIPVDVDVKTLTIDPSQLAHACTKQTKAIIPVHVSGRAAAMTSILNFARKHGLFVIEDAAEAFGSKFGNRFLGTLGNAGCFSFTANKLLTSGQGGLVVTRSKRIHRMLRMIKDQGRPIRGTGGADRHFCVGYNLKFTDIQAALLLEQLPLVHQRLRHQNQLFQWYREGLAGNRAIRLMPFRIDKDEIPLWIDAWVDERDLLIKHLDRQGIICRTFWYPLHRQAPYRTHRRRFPNSTRASKHCLWLPSNLMMTKKDVNTVCRTITHFLQEKKCR